MDINGCEWRWPLGSFVARDASLLSQRALERHERSQAMTQRECSALVARRDAARAAYLALSGQVDAVISVTAPKSAPVGLETTGNPVFVVPGSMLMLRASACRCRTTTHYHSGSGCWVFPKTMRSCSRQRAGSRIRCADKCRRG
jgi:hypothetical protein